MSHSSTSGTAKTFKERGFGFIPVRQAHLDFLGYCYGRTPPPLEEVEGFAMVDANCLPLGLALVHFEREGVNTVHGVFGRWLRVYPKDILRQMRVMTDSLRARGITLLHAVADEHIEGSDTLLEWVGAEKTDKRAEFGPIYQIDLKKSKI